MRNLAHLTRGWALVGVTLIASATTANAAPMLFTLGGDADSDLSALVLFGYAGLTASTGRVEVVVNNTSSDWDPASRASPSICPVPSPECRRSLVR